MKTFVITLSNNKDSVRSAEKVRQSAIKVGYKEPLEHFEAITPDQWQDILPDNGNRRFHIMDREAEAEFGRPNNIGAAFTSHYLLWKKCVELGEPILILEHDAIFVDNIPDIEFDKCVNFGRPSYIRPFAMSYKEPEDGVHLLDQANFLGHHAYAMKPEAAEIFIADVETRELICNDIWMDKVTYPWLEEYRPFPIIADTDFSTLQTNLPHDNVLISEWAKITAEDSPHRAYIEKYFPQVLVPQSNRHIKAIETEPEIPIPLSNKSNAEKK